MPEAADSRTKTSPALVAICGNPNCGKTTIFNAMTGLSQKVGNYPGVTVEKVLGHFYSGPGNSQPKPIIDVPGTYSLSAFSPDEYVAASSLYGGNDGEPLPDIIISVIDATNLERSLYLLLQVIQVGRPVVVALNMIDLSRKRGLTIDRKKLSELLGRIPVVEVVGNRGKGIDRLIAAVTSVEDRGPVQIADPYDASVESLVKSLRAASKDNGGTRAEYLRIIFDVDGPAQKRFKEKSGSDETIRLLETGRQELIKRFGSLSAPETVELTRRAGSIAEAVITRSSEKIVGTSEKIDRFLLHPVMGPIALLAIMLIVFQSIFSWAEPLINMIGSVFGGLSGWVEANYPEGPLRSLISDGVIGGVGSVIIFVPQIVILFLFISFLEDSGYMSRASFLVDRMFRWCGLSGKSFIPLLSSFACAVPGVMAARTIDDRRLRIMTIVVAPLMSCSARLPIYTIMIAAFIPYYQVFGFINIQGLVLASFYLIGIIVAIIVAFIMKLMTTKTETGTFIMEMPSYKVPTLKVTFMRVYNRLKAFIARAGSVILAITIIIWALSYFPRSEFLINKYDQLISDSFDRYETSWTHLNGQLMSIIINSDETDLDAFRDRVIFAFSAVSREEANQLVKEIETNTANRRKVLQAIYFRRLAEVTYASESSRMANDRAGEFLRESYFGKMGRFVEPVFEPLGWDWKISMAVLASFPAREVIIATLGTIYNLGSGVDEESTSLIDKMRLAKHDSGSRKGEAVFSIPVALSVMIFFALCCQCGATLVTIRQETNSWFYPIVTFSYMTAIAYLMALVVYQVTRGMGL